MITTLKKYKVFIFIFLSISTIVFFGIYTLLKPQKTLPIFTPRDVNPQLVDTTIQHVGYNHRIADFKFINQNGKIITQEDYKDKIYVAEFFFTTCPTICPIMTENMVWLQDKIKDMPDVLLLSHSVTPDIDSVPVLKKYALEKGVIDSKWNLVTGNKKDIYYIARKSYLAVETGKPEELYDMVHTENFVLIDKKGRIRGFYDGTNLDKPTDDGTKNVTQLLEDIKWLSEKEK
ncbi:SCO family protein [uncultured Flavobacterium sp.]|uniref:SCO family protein n=1 Tax=uncultured Flavobacterium sp. TaxID=165435 RepID=UPI0030EE0402|tara:strand:+ start:68268 stop:68963 length:696 start_codon:yes stop_codon:yes gene_type:complete